MSSLQNHVQNFRVWGHLPFFCRSPKAGAGENNVLHLNAHPKRYGNKNFSLAVSGMMELWCLCKFVCLGLGLETHHEVRSYSPGRGSCLRLEALDVEIWDFRLKALGIQGQNWNPKPVIVVGRPVMILWGWYHREKMTRLDREVGWATPEKKPLLTCNMEQTGTEYVVQGLRGEQLWIAKRFQGCVYFCHEIAWR